MKVQLSKQVSVFVFVALAPISAQSHDWYEINFNIAQCFDLATFALATNTPQMATPATTEAFYESLGDSASPIEVKDPSGGPPIIILEIENPDGSPNTAFTFYPSLNDCENSLAIRKEKGLVVDPNDMK